MSRTLNLLVISLVVLLPVMSVVASDGDGGSAGAWMQVPIGARPTAMGGAHLGVSNAGAAPLFNPAGVAGTRQSLFATSYRAMQLDRKLGYATFVTPSRGMSAVSVSWRYAGSGPVMMRNGDGDPLGTELSEHDHEFSVLFGKRFEDFLSAGIKMAYLHSQFAEMTSSSVAFDLGIMLHMDYVLAGRDSRDMLPVKDMQVGIVLRRMEASYIWNDEDYIAKYESGGDYPVERDDNIPVEFGLGLSARFLDSTLLVATDVLKDTKRSADIHAGAEYMLVPEFALRSGFSDGRFTAGFGYLFKLGAQSLSIDYAFSTDKADEGSEHVFSFDLSF